MDVKNFRSTQAPLRDLYSKDAQAAFLTLKARGIAGDGTVTCKVETGRGIADAGIHPKAARRLTERQALRRLADFSRQSLGGTADAVFEGESSHPELDGLDAICLPLVR